MLPVFFGQGQGYCGSYPPRSVLDASRGLFFTSMTMSSGRLNPSANQRALLLPPDCLLSSRIRWTPPLGEKTWNMLATLNVLVWLLFLSFLLSLSYTPLTFIHRYGNMSIHQSPRIQVGMCLPHYLSLTSYPEVLKSESSSRKYSPQSACRKHTIPVGSSCCVAARLFADTPKPSGTSSMV